MTCDVKPERNLKKAIARIGEAARGGADDRVPAGALPLAVFLPERGPRRCSRSPSRSPARSTRGASQLRAASTRWSWSSPRSSSGAPPGCTTTPPSSSTPTASIVGKYRKMHIPDDPLYYEKFYFTPGDLGFKALRHQRRPDRRAGVLGSVVSRRRAPDRAAGRRDPVLPDRDRLASRRRRREYGPGAARGVGDDPARHAIANGVFVAAVEPRRHEAKATARVLGPVVRRRPVGRIIAKASSDQEEILLVADRSRADRETRQQLAVPARSSHRRLRRPRLAPPRPAGDRAAMTARRPPRSATRCRPSGIPTPPPGCRGPRIR